MCVNTRDRKSERKSERLCAYVCMCAKTHSRCVHLYIASICKPNMLCVTEYGVTTISRFLKIIGLLCKRAL